MHTTPLALWPDAEGRGTASRARQNGRLILAAGGCHIAWQTEVVQI